MSALTTSEILLRILLAFVAGFAVGWERESHGRPAGLRTTILACVAAAVAMILSEKLFAEGSTIAWRPDPARLGAGILTGIGFLGAGTIIRHGNVVRGVTTAASLWFVTVIGLAFGSGEYVLGLVGMGVALVTLFVLPLFEKNIETDWHATLTVTLTLDALPEEDLKSRLKALGVKAKMVQANYDLERKQKTIAWELKLKKPGAFSLSNKVIAAVTQCPGVLRVVWA